MKLINYYLKLTTLIKFWYMEFVKSFISYTEVSETICIIYDSVSVKDYPNIEYDEKVDVCFKLKLL